MKASDRLSIVAFRTCIVSTMRSSVSPWWATSRSTSARGMTPITSPPAASAASAASRMSPTLAPPYTSPIPARAISSPSSRATRLCPSRTPGRDPLKMHTRFMRGLSDLALSAMDRATPPACRAPRSFPSP